MSSGFDHVSVAEVRGVLEHASVQHPPLAVPGRDTSSTSTRWKRASTSSSRTSPASRSSRDGRARRFSRSAAESAPTRSTSPDMGREVTVAELSDQSMEVAEQRAEGLRSGGPHHVLQRQRRGAHELRARRAVRPRLLVRRHPPLAAPDADPREDRRSTSKPGGTLKVMVYNRCSWKVLWMVLKYGKGDFRKTKRLIAEHSEAQFGSPVTYAYTPTSCRAMLEQHGFRVTEMFVDHIFPWRIPDYVEVPLREGLVLPLDAARRSSGRLERRTRLAPLRDRHVRAGEGRLMRISVIGLGKLGSPDGRVLRGEGLHDDRRRPQRGLRRGDRRGTRRRSSSLVSARCSPKAGPA